VQPLVTDEDDVRRSTPAELGKSNLKWFGKYDAQVVLVHEIADEPSQELRDSRVQQRYG
jgi:hypothetical protein